MNPGITAGVHWRLHLMLTLVVAAALTAQCHEPPLKFLKWEGEIRRIEKRIAIDSPPKGGVVFVGSSSIRLWDLAKSFPELPAVNVGFGGSQIPDCTFFLPRLVFPLAPKTIVFYAGDNDVARNRTPQQVSDDFSNFVKAVHAELPNCRIIFLSIKPSGSRWSQYGRQSQANAVVKEACEKNPLLEFVDVAKPLLGIDGKPDDNLFVNDRLHLSPKGYEKWTAVLKEYLE